MAPGFAGKPAGLFRLGDGRGRAGNILTRFEQERETEQEKKGGVGGEH